jgi:hypothetical protein
VYPILLQGDIELGDSETNTTATIAMKSSYKSHKTLGVMMNPAGTLNNEVSRLSRPENISRCAHKIRGNDAVHVILHAKHQIRASSGDP